MLFGNQDLTDPELYACGDPHAVWSAQRERCPVARHQQTDGDPYWSVTDHATGTAVLQDTATFGSAAGVQLRPRLSEPPPGAGDMLVLTDPPLHTALRAPLRRLFTPRAVAALEPRAHEVMHALLTPVVGAGPVEFVSAVAARAPLEVMGELLGIEPADHDELSAAAHEVLPGNDSAQAYATVLFYYSELLEERRDDPRADVPSVLLKAQAEGAPITDEQIVLTCANVLSAAADTTMLAMSGALAILMDQPSGWEALRSGRVEPHHAVEELLRLTAPSTHVLRTATEPIQLGELELAAGDSVAVWLPALNRDPAVFHRPDELVLDRSPNPHRTFAIGPHVCLGAPVLRLVMRVFLQELTTLCSELVPAGRPEYLGSHILGGPTTLPVELRP